MRKKRSPALILANKLGFRSVFEHDISKQLTAARVVWEYEPRDKVIPYTITKKTTRQKCTKCGHDEVDTAHTYLPDFFLPKTGVVLEAKGYFRQGASDRKKLEQLKKDGVKLVLLFQSPDLKIRKGSKTTYAQWSDKKGIAWLSIKDSEWISKLKSIHAI